METVEFPPHLEDQIEALQNQVNSLQQKIIDLEAKLENPQYALSDATKIIQQADYTLKPNMGSYFQENDNKINSNLQQVEEPRNEISEASKIPLETLSQIIYSLKSE